MKVTIEEIHPEVEYWKSALVCYILGVKPPFRSIDGFIRRIWRQYGVQKVAMLENEAFIVRFRMVEDKEKVIGVAYFA